MQAIAIEELHSVYPSGVMALNGLSLDIAKGEVFGLLGANGAGKSTLIKILSTLLRPSAGRVEVMGRDVTLHPVEIKRRIGVVPQENNLDTFLDVRQNLIFHCRYAGQVKKEYTANIEEWLERLGLREKANETVMHLSGGTRRKVMLAKAFLTNPELLVLDEPTAGLDPEIRSLLYRAIAEFSNNGGTVFLSTHYLEEAEKLCGRVGVLHGGKLIAVGRPDMLMDKSGNLSSAAEISEALQPAEEETS